MYTEMMMSLLERRAEKAVLADDFAEWIAGWKDTWKPKRIVKLVKNTVSREVARSTANFRLPTPEPMSSRLKFVETLISPVSSFSSASSSSLAPSPPTSPTRPLFTTEFFEVRPSAKGGYGAFAIENIAKGTIILTEKALFTAEFTEVFYAYENLKPKERKEYRSLYSYQGVDNELLLAIFKTNRFEITSSKGGIFLKSSRFNHACHPYATCTYSFKPDLNSLVTTAIHVIAAGQEITISYCGRNPPNSLFDNYGFYCDCPGCPAPEDAAAEDKFYKDGTQKKFTRQFVELS